MERQEHGPLEKVTDEEMSFLVQAANGGFGAAGMPANPSEPPTPERMVQYLAQAALMQRGDSFASFAAEHGVSIRQGAMLDSRVARALVLGYRLGVERGSGTCANDLGSLYYRGEFVPRDYQTAAALYRCAMDRGCFRSIVNLGYISERGCLGEPDPDAAYHYFALACALSPDCEAQCKMGDMYARGFGVQKDMRFAVALWLRAIDNAKTAPELAQPASRLAPLFLEEGNERYGLEYAPLKALELFQRAELGFHQAIEDGDEDSEARIAAMVEGQARAREALGGLDIL